MASSMTYKHKVHFEDQWCFRKCFS